MDRVYRHLIKLRLLVILASIAITVGLGLQIPRIRFDSSTAGLVPVGDESLKFSQEVIDTFGNDLVSVVVVVASGPDGVFAPSTLAKIDSLTRAIESTYGVDEVVSLTNATYLKGAGGLLETVPVVPEIPSTPEGVRSLRTDVLGNELFHKSLVSIDGRAAAINIFLRNLPDAELASRGVDDHVREMIERARGPEELYYAGVTNTRMFVIRTLGREIVRLAPLSLATVAVVLSLTLRSTLGVSLPLMSVTLATIWTVGLIALAGRPISPTSSLIPPLMIAVGNAYGIHLVARFRRFFGHGGNAREAIVETLRETSGPVMMTACTTMIGFAALMVSPIPNIRVMGLFATIGVFFAALIAVTLVPAVLSFSRTPPGLGRQPAAGQRIDTFLAAVGRLADTHGVWIMIITAVVVVIAIAGITRIKIDTNFVMYFKPSSEVRVTADIIAKNLAGASTFYVAIDGHEPDSMKRPEVLRAVDDLQRFMESLPGIDKTASIVDHLKRLHMAINDDDPAYKRIPESQGIIDEELLLFSISHDPARLERYVTGDYSQMSVFVRSSLLGSEDFRTALDQIQEFADSRLPAGIDARSTGSVVVLNEALESIALGQRNSLVVAVLVVLLLMAYIFRSGRAALVAMIPNLFPIVILFGVMGWSGLTLNSGTSVIAAMALGIAVDDTIHYLVHVNRKIKAGLDQRRATLESLQEVGRPILFTSMTLSLGFLVLLLSDFLTISSVGILTSTTMVAALLADILVLPAVLLAAPTILSRRRPPRE